MITAPIPSERGTDRCDQPRHDDDRLHHRRRHRLQHLHDRRERTRYLCRERHDGCTDPFEEVAPRILELLHGSESRPCGGFCLPAELALQLVEDHRLRLGYVARLGEFLDYLRLLLGEGDAGTRQRRELRRGIGERLAQLQRRRTQIHLQRCGEVQCQRLRALEVLARDVGESQQAGGGFVEDRLVAKERLALQLRSVVDQLPEVVTDGLIRNLERLLHLRLGFGLHIGQVQRHAAQCRKGCGEFQRQRLADGGQLLFERAESFLDLLRLLLELIRVGSDLYKQIGDSPGHGCLGLVLQIERPARLDV